MLDDALTVIACGASVSLLLPGYLVGLRRTVQPPVRLLLTASAQRFVQPQAAAWCVDEVVLSSAVELNPVECALRSRAVVVLPATANMLAAAALGLASTPAQTVLLATARPALFFPAMNQAMWDRDSTRRHVATLRGDGHVVVDPAQREVFELWQRDVATGPTLPPPDEVSKIVDGWLGTVDG
jgi:phosphopantothenoylcysteine synthetase/decarboxylase